MTAVVVRFEETIEESDETGEEREEVKRLDLVVLILVVLDGEEKELVEVVVVVVVVAGGRTGCCDKGEDVGFTPASSEPTSFGEVIEEADMLSCACSDRDAKDYTALLQ